MSILQRISESVFAMRLRQRWPESCKTLILDFDGVLTDDLVITSSEGIESVVCSRSDGLGVEMMRESGIRIMVLSREDNVVVKMRCEKLNVEFLHGVKTKLMFLKTWSSEHQIPLSEICYIGNDVNDLECIKAVGLGLALRDSHREAKRSARLVIPRCGGRGAVRLIADSLL